MRSFLKISSIVSTTALIAALALPVSAMAVELSNSSPSYGDRVPLIHNDYGKDVVIRSDISIDELKKMRDTVSDQSRQIEELKRNSGSSSNSSSSEISNLKQKINDQDRAMDQLKRTVEDLSRKVK